MLKSDWGKMRLVTAMALACLAMKCVMSMSAHMDISDISDKAYGRRVPVDKKVTFHDKRAAKAIVQWAKRDIVVREEEDEGDDDDDDEGDEEIGRETPALDNHPEEHSGLNPETLKSLEESGLMFAIIWRIQNGERDVQKLARVFSFPFMFDKEPIIRFSTAYIYHLERMLEEEERRKEEGG